MLNCKDLSDTATTYIEGECSLAEKISIWVHMAICVHCRRYLRQLNLGIQTLRLMTHIKEPTQEEIEQIVNRIKSMQNLA